MKTLPWLLVGMLLVVAFWGWLRPVDTAPEGNREKDTATFVDTIPYFVPVPRDSILVKYVIARLPSAVNDSVGSHAVDTVHRSDSVAVAIPITQKVYEDSTYRAYVSGYRPRLDSLFLFPRTQIITVREKPRRWNIGVGAGYGLTPRGFQPFVGVTVSYTLWAF